jgi:1L-myo-inositol 1-phosphate cytidylyltransferase
MKAVIIAAGRGSRLAGRAASKPLLAVSGRPLIDRVLDAARRAGIQEFVVVTGYAADAVEAHLRAKAEKDGVSISVVRNEEWERENGLSVLKAKGRAGERFLLLMADHIIEPGLLDGLCRQPLRDDEVILAVDRRIEGHPHIDLEDVTRVLEKDGRIAAIGKNIPAYNAFDTGAFLCTPALFSALEASQSLGDFTLSGGMRKLAERGGARAWPIGDAFWIDVDDEQALRKAEAAIASGLVGGQTEDKSATSVTVSGRSRKAWKRVRLGLTGAGLILLLYLLSKIGTEALVEHLARFGPWFLVTVSLGFFWLFLQALAWRLVQAAHSRPVPLLQLYRAKIVSDTLNALVPSVSVGGDAARAFLIRRHVPLKEGIPRVLVDKTLDFSASVSFLLTGFLLSLALLDLPGWMNAAAAVCLGGTLAGIAILVVLQKKGVRWTLDRVSKIVPRVRGFLAAREGHVRDLDANLRALYAGFDRRTAAAAALHYAARLVGVLEVLIVLSVLGAQASFIQSLFMSTGVTIVNTAFFAVPGHFGIMESAHVVMARSLGFSAALGLSLGVIRRLRKLATVAVGLVLLAFIKDRG